MSLKKILSLLLAMTMLFSCIGITAMAEDNLMDLGDIQDLIDSGEENIEVQNNIFSGVSDEAGLKEALQAGGSITLGGNIEITEMIEISVGVEVELDLAGYAITSAYQDGSDSKHIYPFSNYGVLTIADSSTDKTGSISGRGIYNQDGAKITVNNAKIVSQDTNGGACIWGYGDDGEVYLNDATLIGYTGVVSSEGYVEINGGTYTCYSGIADDGTILSSPTYNIRAYNGLKITDGDFTSRHGVIYLGGGEAVIEDGTYTIEFKAATTSNVVFVYGDTDLTINGGEFISDDSTDVADSGAAVLVDGDSVKLTINDGTYVGMNGMVSGNDNTVIKGGSFDTVFDYNHYGSIEEFVEIGAVITVAGETIIKNEDGTMSTAVTTFEELNAAIANGGKIVLANDITTTSAIVTSGVTAEIDLNGNTLKIGAGDNKFNDKSNITIKNGNINIDGVSVSGNAIFCLDEYEETLVTTLTLENVNLTGENYSSAYGVFYIGKSSVLNVNGGVWNLSNDLYSAGGVFKADASSATLNITGAEMTLHNVRRVVTYADTEIKDSTITISGDTDGVDAEMEHGFNRSPLVIDNSTITMTDMVGRGITAENGAVEIKNNSTVTITNAQEATIDVRNGQTVTVSDDSTVKVDKEPTITSGTINGSVATSPKSGTIIGYTSETTIWGETSSNARESYVIKVYSDDTFMGQSALNPDLFTMNGNVNVTWNIALDAASNTDEYWIMSWTVAPSLDLQPTHVAIEVDGVETSRGEVRLNSPDDLKPIYAAIADENGKITSYATSLANAAAVAEAGDTVLLLRESSDTVEFVAGVTLNKNGFTADGVTVAEPSLSGSGTAENPYIINNLNDLKWFRDDVNAGNTYAGKTVTLIADIDLAGEEWTPIAKFEGVFDGGEKTISNLVVNGEGKSNQGFFAETKNGEIKNLTFNNAKVTGRLNVGVVAGTPYTSKYTNIKITGHVEVNGMAYVGGVGGKNAYADWTDITVGVDDTSYVKATSTENGTAYRTYVGGVIGFMGEGGHTVKNVTANINVIGDVCDIGGIVGIAHYGNNFENVVCAGNVTNTNTDAADSAETGGIAGVWHNQKGYTVTFTNCSFTGKVTATGVAENAAIGAAYNATNNSETTSGSLIIDGETAWPKSMPIKVTYKDGSVEYFVDMIDAVPYTTNCPKLEGATITLLDNVSGQGMRFMENDMVFDLNGFTFTITAGTGSQGTNTSGFQIRPEVTTNVIFKNGTINVQDGAPVVWMFNCYATDFIVEDVTVDCANMAWSYGESCYAAVSRSGDNIQLKGTTKIINFNSEVAGDAYSIGGTMDVDDTVVLGGRIQLDEGATLTAGENVDVVAAEGCIIKYENGVYTAVKKVNVAAIGEVKYETLAKAFDAANDGDTITLISDVEMTDSVVISGKTLTLDLGGYTIYDKNTKVLTSNDDIWGLIALKDGAKLTVCGNGKIECNYTGTTGGWTGMVFAFDVDATSELTVDNGYFTNGNGVIQTRGKVTVNNGTFVSHNGGTCIMAVDSVANVTVNDGVFKDSVGDNDVNTGSGAVWAGFGATVNINGGSYDFAPDPSNENVVWTLFPAQNAIAGYGENAKMTVRGGTFVNFNPATDVIVDYSQSAGFTFGSVVAEGYAALPDLNGNYVVGAKPTATVNNLGMQTVPAGNYSVWNGGFTEGTTDMPLSFVMQFLADQDADDMATSPYADWYADFVITFDGIENGSFIADGCYLAGYYGDFGWVKVPVDGMTIEDGVRYPVMLGVGLGQKYDYVCSGVQDFRCALYLAPEILAANPDIKVNLELAVVDNSKGSDEATSAIINKENTYKVVDYDYVAEDFVVKYVAAIGEKKYTSLEDAIAAAEAGDTIILLENIELEEGITIPADKKITLELNGKTITGTPVEAKAFAVINNKGDLTIKDTIGEGKIVCDHKLAGSTSYAVNTITNAGTLTINGGVIENTSTAANQIGYAIDNNSTTGNAVVTIDGGEIKASGSNYYDGIRQFCNSTTLENSVLVKAGSVSSIWMQNPSDGSSDRNTKDVKGSIAVEGGNVKNLYLEPSTEFTASITDGEIGSLTYFEQSEGRDLAGFVSGGTFGNRPVDAFAAEGFEFKANEEGKYEVAEKAELFEFLGMNLDLESSMKANFYILASYFEGTDYYAKIVHSSVDGDITEIVDFADWEDNGSYKQISYTGLVAKNMSDIVTVTIFDGNDNRVSIDYVKSIKIYAEDYIKAYARTDDKWVTPFVDMLNYGAAAQQYFGYNTENLANADIGNYQIYATQNDVEINSNVVKSPENVYGANLDLEDKIVYNVYFANITSDMTATFSYTDHLGNPIEKSAALVPNGGYHQVSVDTLVIADANQIITVTVYDAEGNVHAFRSESINGYLSNAILGIPGFEPLARAMAKFTASAHTALHN